MRKSFRWLRISLTAAVAATLFSCGEVYGPDDLVGTWDGSSHKLASVVVVFAPDGRFRMEYVNGQGETRKLEGAYETDFFKSPIPLSIRNIPQLPHPLHSLIEFKSQNTIRIGGFAPRWRLRPVSFDPGTEITLEKRHNELIDETPAT